MKKKSQFIAKQQLFAISICATMKVHMRTGNESLVNMLAEHGLSISYDRLRRLSTDLFNPVITFW